MECFACGKMFNTTQKGILSRYKEKHERDGSVYWFYRIEGNDELKITTSDGWKQFRAKHKPLFKEGKVEFAHISEFGFDTSAPFAGSGKNG